MQLTNKSGKTETHEGYFLLSHIPRAKQSGFDLGETKIRWNTIQESILFSYLPEEDKDYSIFGIVRRDDSAIYLWLVDDSKPIAKDRLKKATADGGYESESVKSFLMQYADAYTLANEATLIFTKK